MGVTCSPRPLTLREAAKSFFFNGRAIKKGWVKSNEKKKFPTDINLERRGLGLNVYQKKNMGLSYASVEIGNNT